MNTLQSPVVEYMPLQDLGDFTPGNQPTAFGPRAKVMLEHTEGQTRGSEDDGKGWHRCKFCRIQQLIENETEQDLLISEQKCILMSKSVFLQSNNNGQEISVLLSEMDIADDNEEQTDKTERKMACELDSNCFVNYTEKNWHSAFTKDTDGDTLLHNFIIFLKEDAALDIIDHCPTLQCLNICNNLFQTPLHLAVITNQLRTIRRLVVAGADIESRDRNGNTPLHLACRNGNVPIVKALLSPVKYTETRHRRFESEVRIPQNMEIPNYDGHTCFHLAATGCHFEVMRILAEFGADVNSGELKSGRTTLHEAAWSGKHELVTFLLQIPQCDANAHAYDGSTPFDLARSNGHGKILKKLALHGASANKNDSDDDS